MKNNLLVTLLLVSVGVLFRLLPHPVNVAPLTAIALLAGIHFKSKFGVLLPLAITLVTDLFLGFYSTMLWVYGSYILIYAIGTFGKKYSFSSTLKLTIISSVIFFIVTNVGVWLSSGMYARSFAGLIECFTLALPFFRNSLLGDMFYVQILFWLIEYVKNKKLNLQSLISNQRQRTFVTK